MREILFRAKNLYSNEWLDGFLVARKCNTYPDGFEMITDEGINHDELGDYQPDFLSFHVNPETIGQFTGLTDKNGKKIFEGDIVKNEYEDRKYQYFKIFYNDKTLQWEVMNKYGMRGILHNVIGNMEVIGNIHDNPELLGGE